MKDLNHDQNACDSVVHQFHITDILVRNPILQSTSDSLKVFSSIQGFICYPVRKIMPLLLWPKCLGYVATKPNHRHFGHGNIGASTSTISEAFQDHLLTQ